MRRGYWHFVRAMLGSGRIGWLAARAMQYAGIKLSYALGRPLSGPALGVIITNYTCNFKCRMCDMPGRGRELSGRGLKEFTTPQMLALIDGLRALGAPGIGFTGGEPLLRPDIFRLLAHSKKLGMITHLNTNAYLLDAPRASALFDCGVDSLNISLDAPDAEAHDAVRGHARAFEHVMTALAAITSERKKRGSKLRIKLVTVLDRDNIKDVRAIVDLARDSGADCVEFIPRHPFNRSLAGDGGSEPLGLAGLAALGDAINYLRTVRDIEIENSPEHLTLIHGALTCEPSPIKCYAGYNSLIVDCYGEVTPCWPWMNYGKGGANLRDFGGDVKSALLKLWRSKKYAATRREVERCEGCHFNCQAELNLLFNPASLKRKLRAR